ncbi:hypothetical protein BCI9360_02451 [Bacillus sp. CECT 9360]|nr:hypothetical protein BCI9360_02451 [Bacillus sp. CECT 9360]
MIGFLDAYKRRLKIKNTPSQYSPVAIILLLARSEPKGDKYCDKEID